MGKPAHHTHQLSGSHRDVHPDSFYDGNCHRYHDSDIHHDRHCHFYCDRHRHGYAHADADGDEHAHCDAPRGLRLPADHHSLTARRASLPGI